MEEALTIVTGTSRQGFDMQRDLATQAEALRQSASTPAPLAVSPLAIRTVSPTRQLLTPA